MSSPNTDFQMITSTFSLGGGPGEEIMRENPFFRMGPMFVGRGMLPKGGMRMVRPCSE
jgi:hypothetical protein